MKWYYLVLAGFLLACVICWTAGNELLFIIFSCASYALICYDHFMRIKKYCYIAKQGANYMATIVSCEPIVALWGIESLAIRFRLTARIEINGNSTIVNIWGLNRNAIPVSSVIAVKYLKDYYPEEVIVDTQEGKSKYVNHIIILNIFILCMIFVIVMIRIVGYVPMI